MFSGIIEAQSSVLSSLPADGVVRVQLERPRIFNDLKIGDSVSVNGVCLTVESLSDQSMGFALGEETLIILGLKSEKKSIVDAGTSELLSNQNKLNLERSLRFGDRIHGHFVTGHVEELGTLVAREFVGESLLLKIKMSPAVLSNVIKKGSICLNGVSLTVNDVSEQVVSVCLIPQTVQVTNLGQVKIGGKVTIETDYLAKSRVAQIEADAKISSEINGKISAPLQRQFNSPEELIEDIRIGKMVILVDSEDRENEGDLILAADHVTPEKINFMSKYARGLICLALSAEQVKRLNLPLMVSHAQNYSSNKTAFTVSIEAASGVSTGISAADRACTVFLASRPTAVPGDVHSPGHIFPIRARDGGVLVRPGHTEGSVDLAILAGLNPSGVICEVMNDDGTMARVPDLFVFAQTHNLKIGTIVDLIGYRQNQQQKQKLNPEEVFNYRMKKPITGDNKWQ